MTSTVKLERFRQAIAELPHTITEVSLRDDAPCYRPANLTDRAIARRAIALALMSISGPDAYMGCWTHVTFPARPRCAGVRACDVSRNPHTTCGQP